MKPEILWEFQKESTVFRGEKSAELTVIFHFPFVEIRIVKEKPHTLNGSSMITDRAIQKFLGKPFNEVAWRYGDRGGDFQVKLEFGSKALKKSSFEDISKFIHEFDSFIRTETNQLINPR